MKYPSIAITFGVAALAASDLAASNTCNGSYWLAFAVVIIGASICIGILGHGEKK